MAKKIVNAANNVFVADLSQFKLSEAQLKSIESQIQQVVMTELARMDNGGFVVAPRVNQTTAKSIITDRIRTRGIWPIPVDKIGNLRKDLLQFQSQFMF